MKKFLLVSLLLLNTTLHANSCYDVFSSLIPTQSFNQASFTAKNLQKLLGSPRTFKVDNNAHLLIWSCQNPNSAALTNRYNGSIALVINKNHDEDIAWSLFSGNIGAHESLDTDNQTKQFEMYQKVLERKFYPIPKDNLSCDDIFKQMHTVFSATNNYPVYAETIVYPWEDFKWLVKNIGNPTSKLMMTHLWECSKDHYVSHLAGGAGGYAECDENFCFVNYFIRTTHGLRTDFSVWPKQDWLAKT